MKFKAPLTEAILLKRHFRFLVDVALRNNKRRVLYCPNLGAIRQCDVLGTRIWYSNSNRLSQGYLDTWELAEVNGGWLVLVNPLHSNVLVREALELGIIPELQGFQFLQSGVIPKVGNGVELLIRNSDEQCFMHIEPVLWSDEAKNGYFPEEPGMGYSALMDLIALKEMGHRAVLFYCVQHNGIQTLRTNDLIDPAYGKVLREAVAKGVEILAYRASINCREIILNTPIPVLLSENIISHSQRSF